MIKFLLGFALGALVGSPLLWFIVCTGLMRGWWSAILEGMPWNRTRR